MYKYQYMCVWKVHNRKKVNTHVHMYVTVLTGMNKFVQVCVCVDVWIYKCL